MDNLKKIQHAQLDMLKMLLDVCRVNNLRIWAEGGTLLGAVRHKGFIPWDDDIDIAMLRSDYEKLKTIALTAFHEPYFFQTAYSDVGYSRGHAQLRRSDMTAILPQEIWQEFNQGLFIDIFVYDFMPDDRARLQADIAELERLHRLMRIRNYGPSISSISDHLEFRKAKAYFRNHSFKDTFRQFESIFGKNTRADGCYINCPTFATHIFSRMNRHIDWYEETIEMPFEDTVIPVPKGWDNVLSTQYGDSYMTPVKAPTCHGEVIFDLDRPYREVLSELRAKAGMREKLHKFFLGNVAVG